MSREIAGLRFIGRGTIKVVSCTGIIMEDLENLKEEKAPVVNNIVDENNGEEIPGDPLSGSGGSGPGSGGQGRDEQSPGQFW